MCVRRLLRLAECCAAVSVDGAHQDAVGGARHGAREGGGAATTGASDQNTDYGVIVGGHDSAVATAEQINKTETYRDPDSFADIVRGMHLYGRKILRPEALVTAKYNLA